MKKFIALPNGTLAAKPTKAKLTLSVDAALLFNSRRLGLNISAFLEMKLRELFEMRERILSFHQPDTLAQPGVPVHSGVLNKENQVRMNPIAGFSGAVDGHCGAGRRAANPQSFKKRRR